MKIRSLVLGAIIGVVLGFGVAIWIFRNDLHFQKAAGNNTETGSTNWHWPDSLDATRAAAQNHHIVYEDDKVRILEVVLRPHEFEHMHTHKLPSIMFGSGNADTSSFDILYYRYGYDTVKHRYFVKNSVKQHSEGSKPGEPDSGYFMKPEGPHAIKNLSNVKIDVYRLEFKNKEDCI